MGYLERLKKYKQRLFQGTVLGLGGLILITLSLLIKPLELLFLIIGIILILASLGSFSSKQSRGAGLTNLIIGIILVIIYLFKLTSAVASIGIITGVALLIIGGTIGINGLINYKKLAQGE